MINIKQTNAQRKYSNSAKGKAARLKYQTSEKGREARKRYMANKKAKRLELKQEPQIEQKIVESAIDLVETKEKKSKIEKEAANKSAIKVRS